MNGQTEMKIKIARIEDAEAACNVLRRSITELCQPDHHDDQAYLSKWLESKTPQNVARWIADESSYVFVAEDAGAIRGVGALTASGVLTLNYVSPEARFTGVSKALLKHLEMKARELGITECRLETTLTARRFYLSAGYTEQEGQGSWGGRPMLKRL
jgi:GNAT superfamily N-acetyltransferase